MSIDSIQLIAPSIGMQGCNGRHNRHAKGKATPEMTMRKIA